MALACVVFAAAVIPQPPKGADMWLYAVEGRTVVIYGDSPYTHPPSDYPNDPWVHDLQLFRGDRPLYGPAFIATAAAVAKAGGDSRLAVRLTYQLLAAGAVLVSMVVLARRGVRGADLALLAINPIIVLEVVSQGRLDGVIGLCLLVAVVVAAKHRPYLAAAVIAIAALIKLPVALALVALAAWVWRSDGSRKATGVLALGAIAIAAGYAAAGGVDAVRPLLDARTVSSGTSVWVFTQTDGLASALGDPHARLGVLRPLVASMATGAGIALGALLVAPRLRDRVPVLVLALPLAAYLLTSPYAPDWYLAWILPLLVVRRSTATAVMLTFFGTMFVSFHYNAALHFDRGLTRITDFVVPTDTLLNRALHAAVIVVAFAGIIILAAEAVTLLRRRDHARGASIDDVLHRTAMPSTGGSHA